MLLLLQCKTQYNFLFGCVKLIGYFASIINAVSSNPCVGP